MPRKAFYRGLHRSCIFHRNIKLQHLVQVDSRLIAGFKFEGGCSDARAYYSSEFCLGLFNIACFFTEVSHNLVQTTSYILKPHAYREAYGVSLSRQDHAPFPPPCWPITDFKKFKNMKIQMWQWNTLGFSVSRGLKNIWCCLY